MQAYYVKVVGEMRTAHDRMWNYAGAPVFTLEIAGARVRVGAMMVMNNTMFLSEALTQELNLFCSNDIDHVRSLARLFDALGQGVLSLAHECAATFPTAGTVGPVQLGNVQWPYLLRRKYGALPISQPWGLDRPVYLLDPCKPNGLVIKFWQVPDGDEDVDDPAAVQKAWHKAGVAPEVVSVASAPYGCLVLSNHEAT
jgi:hypothetical protein